MTRRRPPESHRAGGSPGPLWDAAPVQIARERGHAAAQASSSRASRIDPAFRSAALATVKRYAQAHDETFLFEHIPFDLPLGADRRAVGHIAKEAQRLGWITPSGYAPAASSNGAPKCRWKSLIFEGASA